METLYKLTDQNLRTYKGYQWVLGQERTAPGNGPLCSDGWIHAYTDPLLAVLLNPIHANIEKPRLFRCAGVVGATDCGLKVGCTSLTLVEALPLPTITTEQRVRFAIMCALKVCSQQEFQAWARKWLSGEDRSAKAAAAAWAKAAAWAEAEAWAEAAWAAEQAAWAVKAWAEAAEAAAEQAAKAEQVAAEAAAWAAEPLDLISLAREAVSA